MLKAVTSKTAAEAAATRRKIAAAATVAATTEATSEIIKLKHYPLHIGYTHSLPFSSFNFSSFSRDQTTYLVHSASAASLQDVVPVLELPPPPDGGWGWAVVAASFLCNLVLDGIAYSFGLLLPHLVESFGPGSAPGLAWVGSLLAGVYQVPRIAKKGYNSILPDFEVAGNKQGGEYI